MGAGERKFGFLTGERFDFAEEHSLYTFGLFLFVVHYKFEVVAKDKRPRGGGLFNRCAGCGAHAGPRHVRSKFGGSWRG